MFSRPLASLATFFLARHRAENPRKPTKPVGRDLQIILKAARPTTTNLNSPAPGPYNQDGESSGHYYVEETEGTTRIEANGENAVGKQRQECQPHEGVAHREARPQHLGRRVWRQTDPCCQSARAIERSNTRVQCVQASTKFSKTHKSNAAQARPATLSVPSVSVVTKRSPSTSPYADPRLRKFSSVA
jgi:hypothetical protein